MFASLNFYTFINGYPLGNSPCVPGCMYSCVPHGLPPSTVSRGFPVRFHAIGVVGTLLLSPRISLLFPRASLVLLTVSSCVNKCISTTIRRTYRISILLFEDVKDTPLLYELMILNHQKTEQFRGGHLLFSY